MPSAAPDATRDRSGPDRFGRDIARLIGHDMPGRFGVAVSGGPDSMALLALAHKCLPGRIEAATIDHGLRPESAQEAAMVAFWCADRAIPHATLKPAEPITGNIQSTARAARYALLEQWREERGIDWLLTAHHADDQLETLLMRLNRGAGVSGLAGIRGRSGTLLRPLLGWRKAELVEYAEAEGLPFVHDPSNSDPRFDRAALRARLAGVDWLDPERASRSASALAEAEEALDWLTRDLAARHVSRAGDVLCLSATGFPREVLRRLVLYMLDMADPDSTPPRGDTLDDAIVRLREGGKVSIGRWLLAGGEQWTLSPAPPRRNASR